MTLQTYKRTSTALLAMGILAVAVTLATRTPSRAVDVAVHPRLLFTAADEASLRTKMTDGVGEDDAAWSFILTRANTLAATSNVSTIVGSDYGLNNIPLLGVAYQLADVGNPNKTTYQDKCRIAVNYIVGNYTPTGTTSGTTDTVHEQAERLFILAQGFDLCYQGVADPERSSVITEIESYLTYATQNHNSPWASDWQQRRFSPYASNKSFMAGSALGMASIALRGESANTALLDSALTQADETFDANLAAILPQDGSFTEGVLYGAWSMRFFAPYIEARRSYDGVDYRQDPGVQRVIDWLAYEVLPNQAGLVNNLNDSLWSTFPLALHSTVLSWAQTAYDSGVARWLWQHAVPAVDYGVARDNVAEALWGTSVAVVQPGSALPTSKLFSGRGLYTYRSGWPAVGGTSNDTAFSFYAGKFWGGHAQEDQGQITLISRGERFLVDTGYSNQAKNTAGHNLVLINGADQHNAGGSIGTDASMSSTLVGGTFGDYLHADLAPAYERNSPFNDQNFPWPGIDWSWGTTAVTPMLNADRFVQVVKAGNGVGEYVVMLDDLAVDGGQQTYSLQLHTASSNTISTAANPVIMTGAAHGNKLDLYVANPDPATLTFQQATFSTGNGDGDTKRLSMSVNSVDPRFLTILRPYATSGEVAASYSTLAPTNGKGVLLSWANGVQDTILASWLDTVSDNNMATDGKLTTVRRQNAQTLGYTLGEGTTLSIDNVAYVTAGAVVSVTSNGATITISNPATTYILYGPTATAVQTANGAAVSFAKQGDWLYVNTAPPGDTTPPNNVNDLSAHGV